MEQTGLIFICLIFTVTAVQTNQADATEIEPQKLSHQNTPRVPLDNIPEANNHTEQDEWTMEFRNFSDSGKYETEMEDVTRNTTVWLAVNAGDTTEEEYSNNSTVITANVSSHLEDESIPPQIVPHVLHPSPILFLPLAERLGQVNANRIPIIRSASDLVKAGHPLCRSREKFLPPDLYARDSCALCYGYIQNLDLFVLKWKMREMVKEVLVNNRSFIYSIAVLVDPHNSSHWIEADVTSVELLESFSVESGRQKWNACCSTAKKCCSYMRTTSWPKGHCPPTWDGWQCWASTPSGKQASGPCPSYSYYGKAASCTKLATKQCEDDGRWFRRGGGKGQEWSNYSSCSVAENIIRRLYVHIAAYSISMAALLPALCIFFSFKQLRVHRITLHKHLFISLLLEAVCNVSFKFLQLYQEELIRQNPPWCIVLNLLTKYSSLTNYMWYLCEGYYLHKLLVSAFAEQNSLVTFYLIGWGFPLLPLAAYTGIRSFGDYDADCWLVPVQFDWIISLPPLLALLTNVIFVVNIIRILVGKVRATNNYEPSQYRKAVRATMMVIPLFGLQYIVTIYRPPQLGCDWLDFYQIVNNVIEGSTGAIVAIIFCYTNSEVLTLLSRSLQRYNVQRKIGSTKRLRTVASDKSIKDNLSVKPCLDQQP